VGCGPALLVAAWGRGVESAHRPSSVYWTLRLRRGRCQDVEDVSTDVRVPGWVVASYAGASVLLLTGLLLPWERAGGRSAFELFAVAGRLGFASSTFPVLLAFVPVLLAAAVAVALLAGPSVFRVCGAAPPLVALTATGWVAAATPGFPPTGPITAGAGAFGAFAVAGLVGRSARSDTTRRSCRT
jgi:hypothetical protein